jgi:hypothetical protein
VSINISGSQDKKNWEKNMKHQIDLDNIWLYGVLANTLKIDKISTPRYKLRKGRGD